MKLAARDGKLEGYTDDQVALMIKYGRDDQDACKCLRWNHIWCINICLCKSCSSDKENLEHHDKFINDVYDVFHDELSKSCDVDQLNMPTHSLLLDIPLTTAIASSDKEGVTHQSATGLPTSAKKKKKKKRGGTSRRTDRDRDLTDTSAIMTDKKLLMDRSQSKELAGPSEKAAGVQKSPPKLFKPRRKVKKQEASRR